MSTAAIAAVVTGYVVLEAAGFAALILLPMNLGPAALVLDVIVLYAMVLILVVGSRQFAEAMS